MPIYTYGCSSCGKQEEVFHPMNKPKIPVCCGQEMGRNYRADLFIAAGRDYHRPIISDSLAISPEQISEHKRLFPDIQVTSEGQPIFENYKQHDNYLKATGFRKKPQRQRRRFTSVIRGKKNSKAKA